MTKNCVKRDEDEETVTKICVMIMLHKRKKMMARIKSFHHMIINSQWSQKIFVGRHALAYYQQC